MRNDKKIEQNKMKIVPRKFLTVPHTVGGEERVSVISLAAVLQLLHDAPGPSPHLQCEVWQVVTLITPHLMVVSQQS